jgi:peptidoglycan hydrolase-like protein with peptidoglycan-binding domain
MRVLEIIKEDADSIIYTVGDSHSNGVSNYGRRPGFKALGKDGSPSTDPMHQTALKSIPKGSTVVISLGANDGGDPQQTAGRVAGIVNDAKALGLKPIYLLPTLPADNKPKDPRREQLRDALKNAISSPIIDLGKASSSDPMGLHLDANGYANIASKIKNISKPSKTPEKDSGVLGFFKNAYHKVSDALSGPFVVHVPNGIRNPDVADVQKGLVALGFGLPKYGIDGIRGAETSSAVAKFQQANGIDPTGVPDATTVAKLNDVLKSKPDVLANLHKSSWSDVKSRGVGGGDDTASVGDLLNSDDQTVIQARESAERYLGRKMSDDEWTALVKVTGAEEASLEGCGYVMGAILNRTRRGVGGNTVIGVVTKPYAFEPVTGASGKETSRLASLPIRNLKLIAKAAVQVLPDVPHKIENFTSNIDAAYKGRDSIKYKYQLLAKGGEIKGNSIFASA